MDTVCVVEAEHTPIIDSGQMGQKEGKIVANDQIPFVHPDLLAHDTSPARTPKLSFVISLLARAKLSFHTKILVQVMHLRQQLWLTLALAQIVPKAEGPLVGGPS
jgi:hypothetical protein